ncbi:Gag-Pol polyprotein [Bienertia sinuspersici]
MSAKTTIDSTSPLYIHPSDGATSMNIEKLQGSSNYRVWRRDMELCLAAKRKLGFVTGGVERDESDAQKKEAWDACNDLVVAWILFSVSDSIKRSVMFTKSAEVIWKNLEARFSVTNGVRKYSLFKHLYDAKQNGKSVAEFYTDLRVVWDELESLNVMPPITEEHQGMAMNSKKTELTCSNCSKPGHTKEQCWACKICGKRGHQMEQCWYIKGFPANFDKGKRKEFPSKERQFTPREEAKGSPKWNKGRGGGRKMAANVRHYCSAIGEVGETDKNVAYNH